MNTKKNGHFELDNQDNLESKVIEEIKIYQFCETSSITLKNKRTEKDSSGIDYKFIFDLYIVEKFDIAKLEYTICPIPNSNKMNIFWELDFKLDLENSRGSCHGMGS